DSVIDGEGLRLRVWDATDVSTIADIIRRSREAFNDWLPGTMNDLADIPGFLRQLRERFEKQSGFYYAIEVEGEVVGQISLDLRSSGRGEIGYWIATDRTGHGFATRAVRAVTGAAFIDG